jgi:hypothetical protein
LSVLDILYRGALAERARQHRWDQPCRTTILVCLPPYTNRTNANALAEVRARLVGHTAVRNAVLDAAHFPVWRRPDRLERSLLVGTRDARATPGLAMCAGGPIGLLDLATTEEWLLPLAVTTHSGWARTTAHTPPAEPWWPFLDRHHTVPDQYPLPVALREFAAQPRIAAMMHHDAGAVAAGDRFDGDCYGPGLTALATGASTYADYLSGVLTYAGGLLTLDRELLVPSWTDVLVEQSLPERVAYHQQAHTYLATVNPTTVLVTVICHR